MSQPMLFLDTETGGLDPGSHSLLSLGLVVGDGPVPAHSLEILVRHEPYVVSAGGLKVNRIDLARHHEAALDPPMALNVLDVFLDQHFPHQCKPIILAGHNVAFDQAFLGAFLERQGRTLEPRFSHRTVDTHALAGGPAGRGPAAPGEPELHRPVRPLRHPGARRPAPHRPGRRPGHLRAVLEARGPHAMNGLPLSIQDLHKTYPGAEHPVFDGFSLEVEAGSLCAVVGPSGVGKTTLLNCIAGLDHWEAGSIRAGDQLVPMGQPEASALFRRAHVGLAFQQPHLLPEFTVEENLLMPFRIAGDLQPGHRIWVAELLATVGLGSFGRAPARRPCPAARRPGWGWCGPWCAGPGCGSWTSPPATWTRRPPWKCSSSSRTCTRTWAPRPCWSPTTWPWRNSADASSAWATPRPTSDVRNGSRLGTAGT